MKIYEIISALNEKIKVTEYDVVEDNNVFAGEKIEVKKEDIDKVKYLHNDNDENLYPIVIYSLDNDKENYIPKFIKARKDCILTATQNLKALEREVVTLEKELSHLSSDELIATSTGQTVLCNSYDDCKKCPLYQSDMDCDEFLMTNPNKAAKITLDWLMENGYIVTSKDIKIIESNVKFENVNKDIQIELEKLGFFFDDDENNIFDVRIKAGYCTYEFWRENKDIIIDLFDKLSNKRTIRSGNKSSSEKPYIKFCDRKDYKWNIEFDNEKGIRLKKS